MKKATKLPLSFAMLETDLSQLLSRAQDWVKGVMKTRRMLATYDALKHKESTSKGGDFDSGLCRIEEDALELLSMIKVLQPHSKSFPSHAPLIDCVELGVRLAEFAHSAAGGRAFSDTRRIAKEFVEKCIKESGEKPPWKDVATHLEDNIKGYERPKSFAVIYSKWCKEWGY